MTTAKRKSRGFSMMEVLVGISLLSIVLTSSFSLFTSALSSFWRTDVRLDLSEQSSLAIRKITQELRSAMVVTISNDGRSLFYQLPIRNNFTDPVTGEFEFADPMQADGVVRSFFISNGSLWHFDGAVTRELVANVSLVDLDPESSLFNQNYPIFSFPAIGSVHGVQIMLVTQRGLSHGEEHSRMSTIANLRNVL